MIAHLRLGLHMFLESLRKKRGVFKTYAGSAQDICSQIVKDCWNGRFFQASTGHFDQFWMRDFGLSVPSLLELGYEAEVKKTLVYALDRYARKDRITTTIYKDRPIDVFKYSSDSLPFLVRSLKLVGDKTLVSMYKDFLERQARVYKSKVFDDSTGLVRKDKWFSSAKDSAKRRSSMYDNCMVAMLSEDLRALRLSDPFGSFEVKDAIKKNFWTGEYFLDDLSGKTYVSGDANTIPYFLGIFDDEKMLKSSLDVLYRQGLDAPLPLKYTDMPGRNEIFLLTRIFTPNYEDDTIWTQWGFVYLSLLKQVDKDLYKKFKKKYEKKIKTQGTLFELYNPDGTIYKTPFYHADTGMLWSAIFLTA